MESSRYNLFDDAHRILMSWLFATVARVALAQMLPLPRPSGRVAKTSAEPIAVATQMATAMATESKSVNTQMEEQSVTKKNEELV